MRPKSWHQSCHNLSAPPEEDMTLNKSMEDLPRRLSSRFPEPHPAPPAEAVPTTSGRIPDRYPISPTWSVHSPNQPTAKSSVSSANSAGNAANGPSTPANDAVGTLDVEQTIGLLQELRKVATPEQLVALHKALLPTRDAVATSPNDPLPKRQSLIRARSMYPAGLATRGRASEDLLRKQDEVVPSPSPNPSRDAWGAQHPPELKSHIAPWGLAEGATGRDSTEPDIITADRQHMLNGGYRVGSLHVTNGAPSPEPSIRTLLTPEPKSVPSRPNFLPSHSTPLISQLAMSDDNGAPRQDDHEEMRPHARPIDTLRPRVSQSTQTRHSGENVPQDRKRQWSDYRQSCPSLPIDQSPSAMPRPSYERATWKSSDGLSPGTQKFPDSRTSRTSHELAEGCNGRTDSSEDFNMILPRLRKRLTTKLGSEVGSKCAVEQSQEATSSKWNGNRNAQPGQVDEEFGIQQAPILRPHTADANRGGGSFENPQSAIDHGNHLYPRTPQLHWAPKDMPQSNNTWESPATESDGDDKKGRHSFSGLWKSANVLNGLGALGPSKVKPEKRPSMRRMGRSSRGLSFSTQNLDATEPEDGPAVQIAKPMQKKKLQKPMPEELKKKRLGELDRHKTVTEGAKLHPAVEPVENADYLTAYDALTPDRTYGSRTGNENHDSPQLLNASSDSIARSRAQAAGPDARERSSMERSQSSIQIGGRRHAQHIRADPEVDPTPRRPSTAHRRRKSVANVCEPTQPAGPNMARPAYPVHGNVTGYDSDRLGPASSSRPPLGNPYEDVLFQPRVSARVRGRSRSPHSPKRLPRSKSRGRAGMDSKTAAELARRRSRDVAAQQNPGLHDEPKTARPRSRGRALVATTPVASASDGAASRSPAGRLVFGGGAVGCRDLEERPPSLYAESVGSSIPPLPDLPRGIQMPVSRLHGWTRRAIGPTDPSSKAGLPQRSTSSSALTDAESSPLANSASSPSLLPGTAAEPAPRNDSVVAAEAKATDSAWERQSLLWRRLSECAKNSLADPSPDVQAGGGSSEAYAARYSELIGPVTEHRTCHGPADYAAEADPSVVERPRSRGGRVVTPAGNYRPDTPSWFVEG